MKKIEKQEVVESTIRHMRVLLGLYHPDYGKQRQDRLLKELAPMFLEEVEKL